MLYRVIDASELPALVSAFLEKYEVVAPVKSGKSYAYATVGSFEEIELDYTTTITPLKKLFLPVRETILTFDTESNDVTDFAEEVPDTIVIPAGGFQKIDDPTV